METLNLANLPMFYFAETVFLILSTGVSLLLCGVVRAVSVRDSAFALRFPTSSVNSVNILQNGQSRCSIFGLVVLSSVCKYKNVRYPHENG